ncbi:hypothetical protein CEP04_24805 [Klebsiella pneumoniae]|nr:hypothetical protein CEP04_24805 [Klebsiella pneumoniae]
MMSLWDALRMNMMISYQELVRTFPSCFSFWRFTLAGCKRSGNGIRLFLVKLSASVTSYAPILAKHLSKVYIQSIPLLTTSV